jgi:hypothetical protein
VELLHEARQALRQDITTLVCWGGIWGEDGSN